MYVPKHFDPADAAWCHALMARESFALLVSTGAEGLPFATHLPLLLAVFQGPHAYVSPGWYATHPSVPTWNYVAVHASGRPRLLEEPARVTALLARMVTTYEAGRSEPWRFDSLTEDYVTAMIHAIVAFELPIERLEGKAKLSQNRPAEDQAGAIGGLDASADPLARATAALMAERSRAKS